MRRWFFLLALSLPLTPAGSQDVVNLVGKSQLNGQLAALWSSQGKAMVAQQIAQSLEGLANKDYGGGNTKVHLYDVFGIGLKIAPPPGFEQLTTSKIQARLPLAGSWEVKASVKLKVKQKLLWWWITDTFTATVKLSDVWARAKADLVTPLPDSPKISKAYPPEIHASLSLSTNKWYYNALLWVLKPLFNPLLKLAIDKALESLMPALQGLEGEPKPFGLGGPGVGAPEPYDYATPALKISQKIQQYHLPYKTLIPVVFQTPYFGTWEESWGQDPGPVASYTDWGDSAIWTGHALAAESFRFKVTGAAQAKQLILTMLDGISQLVTMKGVPGLLNRAVIPISVSGAPNPPDYALPWNGEPHLMSDFISRDQYMGVFFGLATAYDFVDDAQVKAICKGTIEKMLDYILAHGWTALRKDGSVSTVWQMSMVQQLAWVRAARRVNPSKYTGTYWQHAYLSDLCWFGPWTETFDPVGSYFKFNLEHGSFYTYLRLETNPLFWQRGYKGFRIMRKALEHHLQAHFNMCAIGIAPWQAAAAGPETKTLLRLFLKRPRRGVAFTASGVETVVYSPPGGNLSFGGEPVVSNTPQTVAKYPLPPDQRPSTDFLWQRDPFRLSGSGNGTFEAPGVDYILPYWMGRYYGVFAP